MHIFYYINLILLLKTKELITKIRIIDLLTLRNIITIQNYVKI